MNTYQLQLTTSALMWNFQERERERGVVEGGEVIYLFVFSAS